MDVFLWKIPGLGESCLLRVLSTVSFQLLQNFKLDIDLGVFLHDTSVVCFLT